MEWTCCLSIPSSELHKKTSRNVLPLADHCETLFLGHPFLSPTRFYTGLFSFLKVRLTQNPIYAPENWRDAAVCFASASPVLQDPSRVQLSPIPAEMYGIGLKKGLLPIAVSHVSLRTRTLWTAILEEVITSGRQEGYRTMFRLGIVRIKELSQVEPTKEGLNALQEKDIKVLGPKGFLHATGTTTDESALVALQALLEVYAANIMRKDIHQSSLQILGVTATHACRSLKEFRILVSMMSSDDGIA